MLPFSKIACAQCRQFAIRSFSSAVAAAAPSTSTSASNPASAPQRASAHSDESSSSGSLAKKGSQRTVKSSGRPTPQGVSPRGSHSGNTQKRAASTLARLLQEQRQHTPAADLPVDVKAEEERVRGTILNLANIGYTKRRKLQIARRQLRGLEAFKQRRLPAKLAVKGPTIIIRHEEQPQKPRTRSRPTLKAGQKTDKNATVTPKAPGGRRKPATTVKSSLVKKVPTGQSNKVLSSGFHKRDTLTATSESGFNIVPDNIKDRDGSGPAAAALKRLSSSVDAKDETLKGYFKSYLDPEINVEDKVAILDKIKARLSKTSSHLESAVVDSLEQELENLTTKSVQAEADGESSTGKMVAPEVKIDTVTPLKEAEVATLAHGLQRVLFNPGIHWLQHPRTGLYNFTKSVQDVADKDDFDFKRLPRFVRPSQDADLRELLKQSGRKFAGSTSSLTTAMSQIYFALNSKKLLNTQTPSFVDAPREFSAGARLPASIVLRLTDEGTYLVDADKSMDEKLQPDAAILSELGHVLERQLTMEPHQFSRFLKSSSDPFLPHEMRDKREAYHYSASKNLVMRSQLDCHDDRLPRKTFDIKTRATVAIRRDMLNYQNNRGYLISKAEGELESFEREKYDLIRAPFLKYSMQVRIGKMDGIFLAYHSTGQIFGFEYLSLEDIDKSISGSHVESTQAFHLCVGMLETIFERVTADQPGRTIRLHMQGMHGTLQVFAENRPDLSLASSEKTSSSEQGGEFKDENDSRAINSEGIRLYTFRIKNFLNGKQVPEGEAVDFISFAKSMIPESIEEVSANGGGSELERKSAFASFLERRSKEEEILRAERLEDVEIDLSKITWSIQYTVTESRDQTKVMEALRKLRSTQAMFNKEVLLPEGLPPRLVEHIVGKRNLRNPKETEEESSEDGTKMDPISQGRERGIVHDKTKPVNDKSAHKSAWKKEEDAALQTMGQALLDKWEAYVPKANIRYTTKPFGAIARIRQLAAQGRMRLAAAAKADRKKKLH